MAIKKLTTVLKNRCVGKLIAIRNVFGSATDNSMDGF